MTIMDYISIVVFIVLWAVYTHVTTGKDAVFREPASIRPWPSAVA